MKKDNMGGRVSCMGEELRIQDFWVSLRKGRYMEELSINGTMILKLIFKKWNKGENLIGEQRTFRPLFRLLLE